MKPAAKAKDPSPHWVFTFGAGRAEGDAAQRDLLGGKGAYLAEMSRLGLPVPPGLTISSEVCTAYYRSGKMLPAALMPMVSEALDVVGKVAGARFGDVDNPLLVSVRSGSRASMPGMMDTVLNLGLNDETVEGLARRSSDRRFAYDTYRRFIQMYGDVVLGIDHYLFEEVLENYKSLKGFELDSELGQEHWAELVARFKALVEQELGQPFPQDLHVQLWGAIAAVFGSWHNARAIAYRRLHDIPDDWGTAVTVQAMVFGNMGERSATGVVFTRNPSTGENALYGEFLVNAQGEDVVAGLRTPQPLTEAARKATGDRRPSLEALMPEAFADLKAACAKLEAHFRDIQDIEFTVEEGRLWMLQSRSGKRSMQAALKIAVDMAGEGLITEKEAVLGIDAAQIDQLLHPTLDPDAPKLVIGKGLPASPGAASGKLVFDADEAVHLKAQGHTLILARVETSPEDVQGMHAAAGIITTRGGMTSHAAVVARGMGRPCVVGAASVQIDLERETLSSGGETLAKGDVVTIDGSTGQIIKGRVPTREPTLSSDFLTLMGWADQFRRMKVRANADTPTDARQSLAFGADGIGLCRTEHMFFEEGRIVPMREMILADDTEGRRAALAKLLPMQRKDFIELFEIMAGAPGDHPPARSAVARISAAWRGGHRRGGGGHGGQRRAAEAQGRWLERVQSHARPSRLPPPGKLPGDRRDAGASDLRGSHRSRPQARDDRRAGNHGAAGHRQGRARPRQGAHRRRGARGGKGARGQAHLLGRHHGRAAPRLHQCRRDRQERRFLLLRHQRPDPDHVRALPRRRRALSQRIHREGNHPARPLRHARSRRRRAYVDCR